MGPFAFKIKFLTFLIFQIQTPKDRMVLFRSVVGGLVGLLVGGWISWWGLFWSQIEFIEFHRLFSSKIMIFQKFYSFFFISFKDFVGESQA